MKIIVFLFFLLLCITSFANGFYPEESALRMAKISLKNKNIVFVRTIALNSTTLKDGRIVLYEFSRGEGQNFYVAIAEAKGRYDYFDYLMAVNKDFKIEKLRILKYRSEHGDEVKSKNWLSQFEDYSLEEQLRYKKEVSALSGATLSANGLVNDIPKTLSILKESVLEE